MGITHNQQQAALRLSSAPLKRITVVITELSVPGLSKELRITEEEVIEKFHDPRVSSWFAEIWGVKLFGYKRHASSNHPGSDGEIAMGSIGEFKISVRCFNRGKLKFQKSKDVGSRREADVNKDDLIKAIMDVERTIAVDLRQFPKISFYPLDSKIVLNMVHDDRITLNGMTPRNFDKWISSEFDVNSIVIDL